MVCTTPSCRRQGQRASWAQKLRILGGLAPVSYGDASVGSSVSSGERPTQGVQRTDGAGAEGRCWVRCPFSRGGGGNQQGRAGWPVISPGPLGGSAGQAPAERAVWEARVQTVSLVTVFSKPKPGEDPCGGRLQICREAAMPACGWGVTGRLASAPPQVAEGQVVPGRQRLGSSRRDLLSPVGGFFFNSHSHLYSTWKESLKLQCQNRSPKEVYGFSRFVSHHTFPSEQC